jgi:uncharacterized protein YbbC (DUF1343 family)/CubicO group peptidase (beta-lactamase class C family)
MLVKTLATAILAVALGGVGASAQPEDAALRLDPAGLARIDGLIEEAMDARLLPGAVVLVGQGDRVVYERVFGRRAVEPAVEPMTVDTLFDLASLTKVVATTTAVMQLVEQGRVRLTDRVAAHLPGFERHGKGAITIRHLLTHVAGLRPDVDLAEPWEGVETALELARAEVPVARPGERFIYSDIGFFVLGAIVERVSGEPLEEYVERHVFGPLGMRDTMFRPSAALHGRVAPTERCAFLDEWPCRTTDAPPLRGVVHDPTTRRMGGVAGHAGLFGTAHDMARFARMLLGGGALDGVRVLSPLTVAKMTSPATPPDMAAVRGLGWDIDTSFSSNRGELFPIGSYGHTGFTGPSLWVDPHSGVFVVFMASRLHADGKGDVVALRARVATAAAAALVDGEGTAAVLRGGWPRNTGTDFGATADPLRPMPAPAEEPVRPGIDVLATGGYAPLAGKRVGLVTNHTGLARDGTTTIDRLYTAPGVRLVALFSPEHGIRGLLDDEHVPSSRDERTGLPIHSLYGDTRRPTAAMLEGIDAIAVDLQDVGARFYTYATTLFHVMEEAARRDISVVVLDRPNPIGGWRIEGPTPDEGAASFIAYLETMPVRHGMTLGELARLVNAERKIGADLTVIAAEGWRRDYWFDETGLRWVNPSLNMRSLTQATLYPGIGALEWSNISVGRGTDQPFEQLGAPWIDGTRLAAHLNARGLPGVRFYPVEFTPTSSKYAGERCEGVFMVVTARDELQPVRMGLEIAAALWALHGDDYQMENTDRLLGSRASLERVRAGEDPAAVAASWAVAESRWRLLRAPYLLYR